MANEAVTVTPEQLKELARLAAREAVELYAARHPTPCALTIAQAAEMLQRSRETVRRRFKRNRVGLIPYEDVAAEVGSARAR